MNNYLIRIKRIPYNIILLNAERISNNKKIIISKIYWKIKCDCNKIKLKIITTFKGAD